MSICVKTVPKQNERYKASAAACKMSLANWIKATLDNQIVAENAPANFKFVIDLSDANAEDMAEFYARSNRECITIQEILAGLIFKGLDYESAHRLKQKARDEQWYASNGIKR